MHEEHPRSIIESERTQLTMFDDDVDSPLTTLDLVSTINWSTTVIDHQRRASFYSVANSNWLRVEYSD